jgi:class 3 adenylate cyclase/YHS domain-containing protein
MTISREIDSVLLIMDLSGYTVMTEAHGGKSAAELIIRYVEIIKEALMPGADIVERVGDEVLKMGPDAENILRTAIRVRDNVEWEPFFLMAHAGINAGKIVEQDDHYYGTALNLASRVAAHARGGQILCTEQVVLLAGDLGDIQYNALGSVAFKNIANPVTIYEVVSGNEKKESALLDPVCRMQVIGNTAPAKLPFKGKTFYFCSFDCAKAFAERPDRYVED